MIALILAAGLGNRLRPHTRTLPKPLFPIAGNVMLDKIVSQLAEAGATAVMINTHHLHQKIEDHVRSKNYPIEVYTRYEPSILGTGGALKNISDFWREGPLLVINGDIVTDINLKQVYKFHTNHNHPVTMVMHDYPAFNGVSVNAEGFVTKFGSLDQPAKKNDEKKLAYTGIQVVDNTITAKIPADTFCSVIDIYNDYIAGGGSIAAYIAQNHSWHDIGSPTGLRNAVLEQLAQTAFARTGPDHADAFFEEMHLSGDGSDRKWSRLKGSAGTVVLVDHGITGNEKKSEVNSFIRIGRHLAAKSIPVPSIFATDAFAGLVLMEDLGDDNLQSRVLATADQVERGNLYRKVIDQLIRLSIEGFKGFDPEWTYQTERYDEELIIAKECRYFLDAFINGYLGMMIPFEDLQSEFEALADRTVKNALWGLMHRDCQSRNIMWHNEQCHFIDFQGARIGPIQYDLASLMIDPYVGIEQGLQTELLDYYDERLAAMAPQWSGKWRDGYFCCRLTRNLQILGAFAYLSGVKGKTFFSRFIPGALDALRKSLQAAPVADLTRLTELVNKITPTI